MIRRIAVLAAATIVVLPAPPASAQPGFCAGDGLAILTTGLYYPMPLGSAAKTANFYFTFATGGCVHPPTSILPSATAWGTVTGNCGNSIGAGTILGHSFTFTGVGSVLVITGQATGHVTALPDVLAGESCLKPGPGADRFIVTGELALT